MNRSHTEATLRELCAHIRGLSRFIDTRDPPIRALAEEGADYWRGTRDALMHVVELIETDYLPTQPGAPRLQLVRNESTK